VDRLVLLLIPLAGTEGADARGGILRSPPVLVDRFRMDGKVAVVTGASRGIGAACAVALASCGADLVLAARGSEALEAMASKLEAENGRRVVPVPGDLSDLSVLPAVVDAAISSFGRLDVLVNNVGGLLPRALLDTSSRFLEAGFHFNVTVAFELTKLSVPHMLAAGGGSVVNISSAMGHLADRGYLAYGTAKAALDHMTRLMASDLAPRIRVNAVAPGAIETDALAVVLDDTLRETMVSLTPLRRLGRVEEVAAAVAFLATDAASYITGKVLEVDGGIGFPNAPLGMADLAPTNVELPDFAGGGG
jgi:7-alpha-hydroxysteroid dehydrogenase